jgi:hypothetical protein
MVEVDSSGFRPLIFQPYPNFFIVSKKKVIACDNENGFEIS